MRHPKPTSTVEQVARALCIADERDPDGDVASIDVEPFSSALSYLRPVQVKCWTTYEAEAKRFMAAFAVMRKTELVSAGTQDA